MIQRAEDGAKNLQKRAGKRGVFWEKKGDQGRLAKQREKKHTEDPLFGAQLTPKENRGRQD